MTTDSEQSVKYLIILNIVTAGLGDDDLGTDEEEIVLFTWLVLETQTRKVLERFSQYVRPKNRDINDNLLLSESCLLAKIGEERLKEAPVLEDALRIMDGYLQNNLPNDCTFCLLTDGQLHLRQVLHPEATKKCLPLPKYFHRFFDLRKEFRNCFKNNDMKNVDDMHSYLKGNFGTNSQYSNNHSLSDNKGFVVNNINEQQHRMQDEYKEQQEQTRIEQQSLQLLADKAEVKKIIECKDSNSLCQPVQQMSGEDLAMVKVTKMATIIQRMLDEGHVFQNPELIHSRLELGICSRNEFVDSQTVVRARGLPWQSSDQDIANFFSGLDIVKGGVALCLSVQGRRNGEALVRFCNQEHRDMALRRHKHHIGQRYIEVYRASGDDFLSVAAGNNNEAQTFLSRGGQALIRMRGLPYDCTATQVIEFFNNEPDPVSVWQAEDGVLFVRKPDGRPTGDAFVLFEIDENAVRALSKHRESIGSRYIELFRSTTAEVQQVFNRSMDYINPRLFDSGHLSIAQLTSQQQAQQQPPPPPPPLLSQIPLLQQQTGSRKDCIRLRGLPYEAQVEHILEFLGEHSKKIVFQGVHMVYNAQGQPSGEAFIQMDSEASAGHAATGRHHRYMTFGKKQRYIEVFQCSVEDMNLTGSSSASALQRPLMAQGGLLSYAPYGYSNHSLIHAHHAHAQHLQSSSQPAVTLAAAAAAAAAAANGRLPAAAPLSAQYGGNQFNLIYWHYPSPPVSPTTYFHHQNTPAMLRSLR